MEQPEISLTAEKHNGPDKTVRPVLALEKEDVGNLGAVLREYYLSQIKSLKKRKDRKLARQLLENHLVLPKSRQRTSKDAAYIKEILGIDPGLLDRLEESRLIRRIHKSNTNPIYEISHDTLVEPILAERRDREAVARFIKRTWKYAAILLLLWFLCGMCVENSFEVIPDPVQKPKSVDLVLEKQVLNIRESSAPFMLPLSPVAIGQELKPSDSILIKLPIDPIRIASLSGDETMGSDTISIQLPTPLEVPVSAADRPVAYQAFSNVVVPLAYTNSDSGNLDAKRVFAKISGNIKMTTETNSEVRPKGYDQQLIPIAIELGDTLVQAGKSSQSIPVNFTLRLTDFFEDENDKNSIRNALGDRPVKLNYTVNVRPTPTVSPPPVQVEYPSVQGIEVQYSDGTSRFIPGDDPSGPSRAEKVHIVAAGETLFSIAKKYGIVDGRGNTSTTALKQLNGLQSNTLFVGQMLRIPVR